MARCDVCGAEVSSTQPQNQQVAQTVQQSQPAPPIRYAGLALRGCAFIIDILIVSVPIFIVWIIFIFGKYKSEFLNATNSTTGMPFSPETMAGMTADANALSGAIAIVTLLYFILLEGRMQATIGKKICNIRVIRENGTPTDYTTASFRNLFRLLWFLPFSIGGIFFILDIIFILLRSRRVGDIAAKTCVVRR